MHYLFTQENDYIFTRATIITQGKVDRMIFMRFSFSHENHVIIMRKSDEKFLVRISCELSYTFACVGVKAACNVDKYSEHYI